MFLSLTHAFWVKPVLIAGIALYHETSWPCRLAQAILVLRTFSRSISALSGHGIPLRVLSGIQCPRTAACPEIRGTAISAILRFICLCSGWRRWRINNGWLTVWHTLTRGSCLVITNPLWKLPRDTGPQFVVMHYFNISTGADSIHSVRLDLIDYSRA